MRRDWKGRVSVGRAKVDNGREDETDHVGGTVNVDCSVAGVSRVEEYILGLAELESGEPESVRGKLNASIRR